MPPGRRTATVLFIDIVGSTRIASEIGDARFRALLSRFNRIVEACLRRYGGREEDRAGDGFFASFAEPAQAIACACQLTEDVRELGIEIRAGVHTGGTERIGGKTQGIAVVIGARVMSLAGPGEVLVTSTAKELATGAGFSFEDASAHELKGVEGTWQVWAITMVNGRPMPGPAPATEAAARLREIGPLEPDRRVTRRAIMAATGLAAISVVLALALASDDEPAPRADGPRPPAAGTLLQIDPEGRILSTIPIRPLQQRITTRHTAHPLVAGQGGVWLIRRDQLIQIDPIDEEEVRRAEIGSGNPVSINIASGSNAIWLMVDRALLRVHPATTEVQRVAELGTHQIGAFTTDVTAGAGVVWAAMSSGDLLRFDPATSRSSETTLASSIDALAAGLGAVWTLDPLEETLTELDPRTIDPVRPGISISGGVDALAIGEGAVWVLSRSTGQVTPVIDGEALSPIRVGGEPTSITAGGGAIWVGHEDGDIWRIDEATRLVERDRTIRLGTAIRAIAFDEGAGTLWVDLW
jgi:class 3 adenylate cyclase/streptogramin lyase